MQNKLNFKRLKVFPKLSNSDVVCFNLSSDSMKLAHGRLSSSGVQFCNFSSIDIQGMTDEAISAVVKDLFAEWKLKSPNVIDVVPAHFAITKDIEIPSQDPQEIREILDLQAIRHTPYSQEEIIIDYVKVGMRKESYTKLIFMIVQQSLVRRQIAVLARMNVRIEQILFAPEALGLTCSQIFKMDQKDSLQTIIHVDVKFTDFLNVSRGKLVYMRSIPIGTQHLTTEKERYYGRFIEEIKKSVEAYEGEDKDRTSEEYILTGALVEADALQETLRQTLNKPVKFLPYWDYLPLISDQLKTQLSGAKESFLDVVSALMALDRLNVNFVPQEMRLRKSFERKSEDLVKLGISIMILIALVCALLMSQVYFKSAYLKNLTKKYDSSIQKSKKLQKDFSRMQVFKDFSKTSDLPLDVLAEVYRLIPPDVRLTAIKYSDQNKFAVEGNSKVMSTVFSFITSLEESPYFEKAETKRTAKRKNGDEELVDFDIVCMLEGSTREKKK